MNGTTLVDVSRLALYDRTNGCAAIHLRLSASSLAVLNGIARFTDGRAFIACDVLLSEWAGISPQTATKARRRLVESGWLLRGEGRWSYRIALPECPVNGGICAR